MPIDLPPNVRLSDTPAAHAGARVVQGALSDGHPAVVIRDPGRPARVVVVADEPAVRVFAAADQRRRIAAAWTGTDYTQQDEGARTVGLQTRWSSWTDGAAPSPAQTLSTAGLDANVYGAALNPAGQVTLLWDEGDAVGDYDIAWTTDAAKGVGGVRRVESSPGDIPPVFVDLGAGRVAVTWQSIYDTTVLDLPAGRPRTLPMDTEGAAQVVTTAAGDRVIAWQQAGRLEVARYLWRGDLGQARTVASNIDIYSWSFAYRPRSLLFSWTEHRPKQSGAVFARIGASTTSLGGAHRLARIGRQVKETEASFTPAPTVKWTTAHNRVLGSARLTRRRWHTR